MNKQLLHLVCTVGYICPQVDMPSGLLPWTLGFFCQCAAKSCRQCNKADSATQKDLIVTLCTLHIKFQAHGNLA